MTHWRLRYCDRAATSRPEDACASSSSSESSPPFETHFLPAFCVPDDRRQIPEGQAGRTQPALISKAHWKGLDRGGGIGRGEEGGGRMGFWEAFRGRVTHASTRQTTISHLTARCLATLSPRASRVPEVREGKSLRACVCGARVCVSMCFAASPCLVTR